MIRRRSAQLALVDLGAPAPSTCKLCGAPNKPRCPYCENVLLRPGSPSWRRWTRGLMETMQRRLRDAGLHGLIADTASALYAGLPVPEAAMPYVSDIAAQPISVRAYWLLIDHAVMRTHFLRIAWDRGMTGDAAEEWADRLADLWAEEQTRVRVDASALRLRVEVPTTGVRVAIDDGQARAEAEQLAAEEATEPRRMRAP